MTIVATTKLSTDFGEFTVSYHEVESGECVAFSIGDLKKITPIIRIHSACLFGEVFHSLHCDCSQQIQFALQAVAKNGSGVVVYSFEEGRGLGLKGKIQAMELQRTQEVDTVEACKQLGFTPDVREFTTECLALKDLDVQKSIKLISGNPRKISCLQKHGFNIVDSKNIDASTLSALALAERKTKIEKMNYSEK